MPTLAALRRRLSRDAHQPLLPDRPPLGPLARRLLPPDVRARIDALQLDDAGHGFDPFGMSRDGVAVGLATTRWLYEVWFRVQSNGVEHVPATGPAVIACNHSGMLPLDAWMLGTDLLRRGPIGRPVRVVMDHFVPNLPWINLLFARAGAIAGSRGNVHAVLAAGGLLVVFPEGTPGIGKGFRRRYALQPFRPGHAELALRHRAPIVPTAVVGAEESWPQLARIDGIHVAGIPFLPIPGTPLPLPTRMHVWYGEPIDVAGRFAEADADDPRVVSALADEVRARVAELVTIGLRERRGWFR
ncbi:MAG: lysophospholipid acyltransferase family protein [Myxococcota bacterium]